MFFTSHFVFEMNGTKTNIKSKGNSTFSIDSKSLPSLKCDILNQQPLNKNKMVIGRLIGSFSEMLNENSRSLYK